MSERPAGDEWQPDDRDPDAGAEANPADVAEQRLTAAPEPDAELEDLERPLPSEAEPVDVMEQRLPVPDQDEPEV
jgi:hypothetical protein